MSIPDVVQQAARVTSRCLEDVETTDVTLTAGSVRVRCHKSVLAASSPLLRKVLEENPGSDLIALDLGDAEEDVRILVGFMYRGVLEAFGQGKGHTELFVCILSYTEDDFMLTRSIFSSQQQKSRKVYS